MPSTLTRRAALALLGGTAGLRQAAAQAPAWPTRPLRLIVPYAAGGPMDAVARLVAPVVAQDVGQPVVVENRAGAGGAIGTAEGARAAPDGHTVLMTGVSFPVLPLLMRDVPYSLRDFAPLTRLTTIAHALVVPADVPARNVAELIALAKAKPGQLAYASYGNGNSNHLSTELLKLRAGIDMIHVPYRGGGPALVDLLAGRVQAMFATLPDVLPHVRDGKLRALAVVHTERLHWLPDVPTLAEQGFPGISSDSAFGIVVPAATPRNLRAQIGDAFRRAVRQPEIVQRLEQMGVLALGTSAQEYAAILERDSAQYAEVIRIAGIRAE